jgi:hypothetical protein
MFISTNPIHSTFEKYWFVCRKINALLQVVNNSQAKGSIKQYFSVQSKREVCSENYPVYRSRLNQVMQKQRSKDIKIARETKK